MKMKIVMTAIASLTATLALAQSVEDPVVMTIAGEPVLRSEFEYSYNKNNSDGVIDKKSVEEYIDLFVNYKLKVKAAEDARMDTLSSFQKEFSTYRDQQVRPTFITDDDVEKEARRIYTETQTRIDNTGGLVKPAHIFIAVKQTATDEQYNAAKAKADSLYTVLKASDFSKEKFTELANQFSDDKNSLRDGGELPWLANGQTFPEFNEKVYSMQVGETTEPVKTSAGFHIIQLRDKGNFFPYDSQRANILTFIEQRGIKETIIKQKIDSIAKAQGPSVTPQMVVDQKREEMAAADPDLRYLIQEYHDGLLLYEISNQNVWDKAVKDEDGLASYFKKNKKKYKWDEPRFKGIAYRTKETADVEKVKSAVASLPFDEWNTTLRNTFNNDSVLRIRVEKGVFKKGDNAIVDKYEFKTDAEVKELKGYPNVATYGKMISQPESYADVKGLVVADYQEELEKLWVADLRKKYSVAVDKEVLSTVNNH